MSAWMQVEGGFSKLEVLLSTLFPQECLAVVELPHAHNPWVLCGPPAQSTWQETNVRTPLHVCM